MGASFQSKLEAALGVVGSAPPPLHASQVRAGAYTLYAWALDLQVSCLSTSELGWGALPVSPCRCNSCAQLSCPPLQLSRTLAACAGKGKGS